LIDYEFSGYNLRGFEFASYLIEMSYNYNVDEAPFFEKDTQYCLEEG
jgi:thiamine kinase-like enzyme